MQQITFLTRDDVKTAVLEALFEANNQRPASQPEQYIYGLRELAIFLGVGITTAWHLKKSGKIPFYQAGKKLFFKQSEVLAATSKSLK
jgi:hypothetical protein